MRALITIMLLATTAIAAPQRAFVDMWRAAKQDAAGGMTPEDLGIPALYLDFSVGSSVLESRAPDVTATNNAFVSHILSLVGTNVAVQTTGVRKSRYITSAINGQNALLFDGSDMYVMPNLTGTNITQLFVFTRATNNTFSIGAYGSASYPFWWYSDRFIYAARGSGLLTAQTNWSTGLFYASTHMGSTNIIMLNKTQRHTTGTTSGSPSFNNIGGPIGQSHVGYMACIIVWTNYIDPLLVNQLVDEWAIPKWGTP